MILEGFQVHGERAVNAEDDGGGSGRFCVTTALGYHAKCGQFILG